MSDDHLPASTDATPSGSVQAAAPGPAQTHPSPSPAHVFLDQGRLSPRSRAHSAASSVDSSRASTYSHWVAESPSSSAHTRPSLDLPSATLKPAHQVDGFLVDVPGAGQWLVRWNELIDLLASCGSLSCLAQSSPTNWPCTADTPCLVSANDGDARAAHPHRRDGPLRPQ